MILFVVFDFHCSHSGRITVDNTCAYHNRSILKYTPSICRILPPRFEAISASLGHHLVQHFGPHPSGLTMWSKHLTTSHNQHVLVEWTHGAGKNAPSIFQLFPTMFESSEFELHKDIYLSWRACSQSCPFRPFEPIGEAHLCTVGSKLRFDERAWLGAGWIHVLSFLGWDRPMSDFADFIAIRYVVPVALTSFMSCTVYTCFCCSHQCNKDFERDMVSPVTIKTYWTTSFLPGISQGGTALFSIGNLMAIALERCKTARCAHLGTPEVCNNYRAIYRSWGS